MQVPDISLGSIEVGSGDVAFLKVPLIGLGQLKHLPDTGQTASAEPAVTLVVSETDTMLLLPVADEPEN